MGCARDAAGDPTGPGEPDPLGGEKSKAQRDRGLAPRCGQWAAGRPGGACAGGAWGGGPLPWRQGKGAMSPGVEPAPGPPRRPPRALPPVCLPHAGRGGPGPRLLWRAGGGVPGPGHRPRAVTHRLTDSFIREVSSNSPGGRRSHGDGRCPCLRGPHLADRETDGPEANKQRENFPRQEE